VGSLATVHLSSAPRRTASLKCHSNLANGLTELLDFDPPRLYFLERQR
jgi:hypothetical protein